MADWRVAVPFIVTGTEGGVDGGALALRFAAQKNALRLAFGTIVAAVGVYVAIRGALALV